MAEIRCTHCGLPVPQGLVDESSEEQFCCGGCRLVYETIHSCGLDRYYEIIDDADRQQATKVGGSRYETFDNPAFIEQRVTMLPDGLASIELYLEGAHCAACVWLVERLPVVLNGVIESRLDIGRRVVRIVWNPQRLALSRIA